MRKYVEDVNDHDAGLMQGTRAPKRRRLENTGRAFETHTIKQPNFWPEDVLYQQFPDRPKVPPKDLKALVVNGGNSKASIFHRRSPQLMELLRTRVVIRNS